MCRSIDSSEPYSSRPGKRSEASDGLEPETVSGQNSARPSLKGMLTERYGRDVGFADSGFRPMVVRKIIPTDPLRPLAFYIGMTTDLEARIRDHNSGRSKWTHYRGPWKLVWSQECLVQPSRY